MADDGAYEEDLRAFEAAYRNDAAAIRGLRTEGIDVNAGTETGQFPLMTAIDAGHEEAFWALLENEPEDTYREFALCFAAAAGNVAVFDRLRGMGVPPDAECDVNAIAWAVDGEGDRAGRLAIVRRLLAERVDPEEAIAAAAKRRDREMLTLLLGPDRWLDLQDAIDLGDPVEVRRALRFDPVTPRHVEQAAMLGDVAILRLVLEGTSLRPPLALNYAIGSDRAAAVRLLLGSGWSAREGGRVVQAAIHGNVEIVEMLLAAGGDPNESREHGVSAVWEAVNNDRLDALDLLLRSGADPNRVSNAGSPLHMALTRGRSQAIVARLRAAGARDIAPSL